MTLLVKDATGTTQTVKTNDDLTGTAGTPNANVLSVQGIAGASALPVSGPLTDTQLRSTAIPVAVTFPATQPVSISTPLAVTGTFWPATQPVSGPLTDTQLRATAVPVAVTFPVSQAVAATTPALTCADRSGAVTVGGTAQSLMAANPLRRGYRVQNVSSADLWLNDTGSPATAAPPSIKLAAGALYESPPWGASSAAISILGAASGQAFAAMEG
jgi:hypothetical protein